MALQLDASSKAPRTRTITAEEIKRAVAENNISYWIVRHCSMCNVGVGYKFKADTVAFNSSCDCTAFCSDLEPRNYDDVAGQFNIQAYQETQDRMWQEFIASGKPA